MTDTPSIAESQTHTADTPEEPALLARQRTVFYVVGIPDDEDAIYHASRDEDADPPTFREFRLPRRDAADMGHPTHITITVEPGDALNDLAGARDRVARAKRDVIDQVIQARANGRTWAEIGAVFGVSRQSAWESYARYMPEANLTRAAVVRLAESEAGWAVLSEDTRQVAIQRAIGEAEGDEAMIGADPNRLGYVITVGDDGRVYLRMEERPVRGSVREGPVYIGANGVDLYYESDPAGEPLTPEERAAHYAAERARRA